MGQTQTTQKRGVPNTTTNKGHKTSLSFNKGGGQPPKHPVIGGSDANSIDIDMYKKYPKIPGSHTPSGHGQHYSHEKNSMNANMPPQNMQYHTARG